MGPDGDRLDVRGLLRLVDELAQKPAEEEELLGEDVTEVEVWERPCPREDWSWCGTYSQPGLDAGRLLEVVGEVLSRGSQVKLCVHRTARTRRTTRTVPSALTLSRRRVAVPTRAEDPVRLFVEIRDVSTTIAAWVEPQGGSWGSILDDLVHRSSPEFHELELIHDPSWRASATQVVHTWAAGSDVESLRPRLQAEVRQAIRGILRDRSTARLVLRSWRSGKVLAARTIWAAHAGPPDPEGSWTPPPEVSRAVLQLQSEGEVTEATPAEPRGNLRDPPRGIVVRHLLDSGSPAQPLRRETAQMWTTLSESGVQALLDDLLREARHGDAGAARDVQCLRIVDSTGAQVPRGWWTAYEPILPRIREQLPRDLFLLSEEHLRDRSSDTLRLQALALGQEVLATRDLLVERAAP